MKFNDILRVALKESSTTQTRLAEMMNTRQSAIGNALSRSDIYVTTFIKMLDKMGFEIVIQKKTQGRRKDGQMVLTAEEKGE